MKDIVSRLTEHTIRSTNLKNSIEDTEETMLELRRSGVDTTFRETASDHDQKFDHNYFPRVFGDDTLEAERARLRNKLAVATRAKYEPQVKDIMGKQRDDTSTTHAKPVDNRAGVPTDTFMRAKFAFLDTSSEKSEDGATLIRTRDGRIRKATPLEEMQTSWSGRHPNYLEIALHEEMMKMHVDPDKDDNTVQGVVDNRRKHRQSVIAGSGKGGNGGSAQNKK